MVHCVYIPIPEEARVGDILKFNLNDGRRCNVKITQHIGITKNELKITIPSNKIVLKEEDFEINYDTAEGIGNYEVTIVLPNNAYTGDTLLFHDKNNNRFDIEIKSGRPGMTLKTTIKKDPHIIKITPEILKELEERERQFNSKLGIKNN